METFEELLEDHFTAELAKGGFTMDQYSTWSEELRVVWTAKILNALDLTSLSQDQIEEAIDAGYIMVVEVPTLH